MTLLKTFLLNKYYILLLFIILILIGAYREYKTNEGFQNFNWHSSNKLTKSKKNINDDDNKNPLEYFGFKSSKNENFNDTNNPIHSALDDAENINTDDISTHGMKNLIKKYNNNISNKLKQADNNDITIKTINQGKILIDEFKNLFNYELFFN